MMAQPGYLTLTIDGHDIEGESPVHSLDREGAIEGGIEGQEEFLPKGG